MLSPSFKPSVKMSRKKPEVAPCIGQYDTSFETIEGKIRRNNCRGKYAPSIALRRAEKAKIIYYTPIKKLSDNKNCSYDEYLGPGYYCIPREFEQTRIKFKGNIITSKDTRFKDDGNGIPGPGDYQLNEMNPWNKKTYNLLFNK